MAKNENRAQWMRQMGLKGGLLLALVMLLIACVAKQSPHRSEEPPLIGTEQISDVELARWSDSPFPLNGFSRPGRLPVHAAMCRGVDVDIYGIKPLQFASID